MCMYIMNIDSITYKNIFTKIICGKYASVDEAYTSAMRQSININDAFIQIYKFTIPVEKENVQKCIDKYGNNCIGIMLEIEAITPVNVTPAYKRYKQLFEK